MTTTPPSSEPPIPPVPVPPADLEQNPDARTMGMLCHLLGIFTGFIGALVIWLIKKDQSPFVNDQGKEALNWQITFAIGVFAGLVLVFTGILACVGVIIYMAAFVVNVVFCIMGTIKANKGIRFRYPFAIRLIK